MSSAKAPVRATEWPCWRDFIAGTSASSSYGVTTHFLEIFEHKLLPNDVSERVGVFRMNSYIPPQQADESLLEPSGAAAAAEDEAEPALLGAIPLFQLVTGVASSSDGLLCAKVGLAPTRVGRRC